MLYKPCEIRKVKFWYLVTTEFSLGLSRRFAPIAKMQALLWLPEEPNTRDHLPRKEELN